MSQFLNTTSVNKSSESQPTEQSEAVVSANTTGKTSAARYGLLTVLENKIKKEGDKNCYSKCLCDCGKEKIIRTNNLRTGRIKSCGCQIGKRITKEFYDPSEYGRLINGWSDNIYPADHSANDNTATQVDDLGTLYYMPRNNLTRIKMCAGCTFLRIHEHKDGINQNAICNCSDRWTRERIGYFFNNSGCPSHIVCKR